MENDLKDYQLSAVLTGFSSSVRDTAVVNNIIAILEERSNVSVWKVDATNNTWSRLSLKELERPLISIPGALSFCIAPLETNWFPGLTCNFIVGGADKMARPFSILQDDNENHEAVILPTLPPHSHNVNSFSHTTARNLITGAWDGIARVFSDSSTLAFEIKGLHMHATQVLGTEGVIILASASKDITIHDETNGTLITTLKNAHSQAVRKLTAYPGGFASIANDGIVKVWKVKHGTEVNLVRTIAAHTNSLVYDIAHIAETGEIITSSEDGKVCIWSNYRSSVEKPLQTLHFSGAIRSVKCMENGDIICSCADQCVRIFTRNSLRLANPEALLAFAEVSNALCTHSASSTPGKKEKETKIIKENGVSRVYQWTSGSWIYIGEAVENPNLHENKTAKRIQMHVEISPNFKVEYEFNSTDSSSVVAQEFCKLYGLNSSFIPEIEKHVDSLR